MRDSSDDREGMTGAVLATTVTSIALEMVAPALLGYWIGWWLGVPPLLTTLLTSIGAALGLFVGIRSLLYLTRPKPPGDDKGPGED